MKNKKSLENNVKTIFSEDQLEMLKSKTGKVGQWSNETVKTTLQLICAAGVQGGVDNVEYKK